MAEIEQLPPAPVPFVARDKAAFDLHIPLNQGRQAVPPAAGRHLLKQIRVRQHPVLEHLGGAVPQAPFRPGRTSVRIADHQQGLVTRADPGLALRQVAAGRAASRGVHGTWMNGIPR